MQITHFVSGVYNLTSIFKYYGITFYARAQKKSAKYRSKDAKVQGIKVNFP